MHAIPMRTPHRTCVVPLPLEARGMILYRVVGSSASHAFKYHTLFVQPVLLSLPARGTATGVLAMPLCNFGGRNFVISRNHDVFPFACFLPAPPPPSRSVRWPRIFAINTATAFFRLSIPTYTCKTHPQQIPPAPSPDGTTPSGGGFGVKGRGFEALQAPAASDSAHHRCRHQNLPRSPASSRTEEETTVTRSPRLGDASPSTGPHGQRGGGGGTGASGARVNRGGDNNSREPTNGRWEAGTKEGKDCSLSPLARELPAFLVRAVGLSGSLRALASCQVVSRQWHDALGGECGEKLFGSMMRASGVAASLRPTVWQTLVLRAVGHGGKHHRGTGSSSGGGSGGGKSGGGGGKESFSSTSWSSSRHFADLIEKGRTGPHAALISRDVPRAFGAVAPHKRRDNGPGGNTAKGRQSLATSPTSVTMTPTTQQRGGGSRRTTMGGAEDGGSERLAFFDVAVGGALVSLLGGDWRRDDDDGDRSGSAAGTPTPPRHSRGRGTTPNNQRRASISSVNSGSGPFSWLNRGVSPDGGGRQTSLSPARERGRFSLASFPLSPFGNQGGDNNSRRAARPPPPSPTPPASPLDCDGGRSEGGKVSPARGENLPAINRRRTTIGSPGTGKSSTPRHQRGRKAIGSPAKTTAAAAAAAVQAEAEAAEVAEKAAQQAAAAAAVAAARRLRDEEAWLVLSEEAWAAVPVESKRECLGNVLFAVAARFPDVGYCQVSFTQFVNFLFLMQERLIGRQETGRQQNDTFEVQNRLLFQSQL